MEVFFVVSRFVFVGFLGLYAIINLQWHSYYPNRVLFHHKRPIWHIVFFMIPIILYYGVKEFFWIFFYFMYIPMFYLWYKKLDKPLVFTSRIKRFFALLLVANLFQEILCFLSQKCVFSGVLLGVFVPIVASLMFENYLRGLFIKKAAKKLAKQNTKVVAITASFGKTSIKNFLFELLSDDFNVQKTPKSVNTDIGIAKEINENLQANTQIFIAEAGARNIGDIRAIAKILEHQYAILGEVSSQHIEYFKTLQNVQKAKEEILLSKNLEFTLSYAPFSTKVSNFLIYGKMVKNIRANLDKTAWTLDLNGENIELEAPILGGFNAYNISAAFLMALQLGVKKEKLIKKVSKLNAVEHRLQKIQTKNRLILDDSYNGNLKGMLSSYELVSQYEKRKVIVTPGIVESDEKSNEILAKKIAQIFDVIILTGSANMGILSKHIPPNKRIRIFDKKTLEKTLETTLKDDDLVLFSNDTPSFM